jgi:hypothetical protein
MAGIVRGRVLGFVLVVAALLIVLGSRGLAPAHGAASSHGTIASIAVDVPDNAGAGVSSAAGSSQSATSGESAWLWVALGVGIGGLAAGLAGIVLALGERREADSPLMR